MGLTTLLRGFANPSLSVGSTAIGQRNEMFSLCVLRFLPTQGLSIYNYFCLNFSVTLYLFSEDMLIHE